MRLLIVEPELPLLRRLSRALREDGYAVDTARAADDGLDKLSVYTYDAILLDGCAAIECLRRERQTPMLLLMAENDPAIRAQALDRGADDCLVKPVDLRELLARLRAIIRRAAGQARAGITVGDVFIDICAHAATRAGQPVTLTAREYAIVEYLALHRGELVTRTALYEHIYDESDHTLSNLLDVHIFSIRKKLGAHFVTTRRGQGFSVPTGKVANFNLSLTAT